MLWAGVPLCALGLATTGIASQWRGGRFAELIALVLLSLGAAALLQRLLRWRLASGLAATWLLALVVFAGVLPSLATALLALAALALGSIVSRDTPAALRVAAGLALCAGVLGWLLPLPIHYRATYIAACLMLVGWRWRALSNECVHVVANWRRAVDAAPRSAAFAVLVLGLASTGSWLPTMQADDVVYHLRLPWQLVEAHRYPLDASQHIWALAPWASDVLQAIPHVISGQEARGPLNLLWIIVTAVGIWRIATALQGTPRAAWLAVALYGSLPLTAALAGSMQTETPSTALLVWLAWLILDGSTVDGSFVDRNTPRRFVLGALLAGGLLGLKLASALLAFLLLPWALWRHRRMPSLAAMAASLAIVVLAGGSSYVYAGYVTHNPFLPLFNAWFRSPYFDPVNFDDARWHAGFDALLPWNLTFHTERYLEAFAGAGGFVLIALAGAWLLALARRNTATMAVAVTILIAALLLPLQYLRYVFPALVLLLPLLAVTALRIDIRRAAWLIAGVCVFNLAFQANSFWLLRVGALKQTVLAAGRDTPLLRAYVPERNLIASIRATEHRDVLALDANRPYVAELGTKGRSVSYYDRPMQRAAAVADADADGFEWAALYAREGISDVLLRPAMLTPAQRAGLERVGAVRQHGEGDLEWWRIPTEASP